MTRHFFIFLGTFVAGALIALVARAAFFKAVEGHEGHPAASGEYAPMVSNPLTPAKVSNPAGKGGAPAPHGHGPASVPAPAPRAAPVDPHAGHGAAMPAASSDKPVNTVCAICGMEVDPSIPTVEYKGKKIGFGCRMCPPKFKADPDRYGPTYLRNEVM